MYYHFNSHPHEEDDTNTESATTYTVNFNSHPHEEDDKEEEKYLLKMFISTHILTKRMTSWLLPSHPNIVYFNSHPHEEDDQYTDKSVPRNHISTHILTKRMTAYRTDREGRKSISTHILTKRMTESDNGFTLLFLFQLTSSRRG